MRRFTIPRTAHCESGALRVTITEQALDLAADVTVDPEAMESPGLPVPGDPAAIAIFTAHRVDEIMHKLSHASQRMEAARSASGDLREYHAERLAGHLKAALDAGHDLAANVKAHYAPEAAELDAVAETVGLAAQVAELTGDGHGHHIPNTPDVYSHEWKPVDGTEVDTDGIRRPGKGAAPEKATGTAVKAPVAKAGSEADAGKALDAAIRSGVASRKAPGQGVQGGAAIVTFRNGAQYVHKDYGNLSDRDAVVASPGLALPMSPEVRRLQVAKEALASRVSAVLGAGAPAILPDKDSPTGFYQPKVAGKTALEAFSGGTGPRKADKVFNSPQGQKIGLMDLITGHGDRHLGNIMITPDGKPVPIDHNDTWGQADAGGNLRTGSPFSAALEEKIEAGKSPFSPADIDKVTAGIKALKPEFDALPAGVGPQYYQLTMKKLAAVREQVAGK